MNFDKLIWPRIGGGGLTHLGNASLSLIFSRVIKIVAPKKAKLSEAETELANQMDKLNEKRAQLQQVTLILPFFCRLSQTQIFEKLC